MNRVNLTPGNFYLVHRDGEQGMRVAMFHDGYFYDYFDDLGIVSFSLEKHEVLFEVTKEQLQTMLQRWKDYWDEEEVKIIVENCQG